jgi:hypothetical protein
MRMRTGRKLMFDDARRRAFADLDRMPQVPRLVLRSGSADEHQV